MCGVKSFEVPCDFELLHVSVINNIDYFYFLRDKYWYANKFVTLLKELLGHVHWYEKNLKLLYEEAHRYDVSTRSQGNGFRSFILIFERCFSDCYDFCKSLINARNSYFFRANLYLTKCESLVGVLDGLRPGLNYLEKILTENKSTGNLMADKIFTAEELMTECGAINQLGFYGIHQGFYYCTSMQRILQGVGIIMATFSDLYQNSGGPLSRAVLAVLNGLKYILNPSLRAQQIVNVAQNSSVEFLKAFWSLSETHFMKKLPGWVCPKLDVRKEIIIPSESINLNSIDSGDIVTIPAPSSHIPPAPVRCLLLSCFQKEGLDLNTETESSTRKKSPYLLFHVHGGGFISQTPESHEIYLRHWAYDLKVPILSVDYNLSPEAPFPRALEEVLLAYAWALNNAEKLGWTGKTICFAGDSAGGNLCMGIVLKTISLNIRRPDAVLCAYTPLILDLVPSPSRLLCWLDPLLPLGFMISCLDAYAGDMQTDGDEYDDERSRASSAPRSRKISSISEILDSSLMFIRQCDWIEVEANEPPVSGLDIQELVHRKKSVSNFLNDYICEFFKNYSSETEDYESDDAEHTDFSIFSIPQDIIFDLKTKFRMLSHIGLNKLTKAVMSTTLYQKVISPLLPIQSLNFQPKLQSDCSFKPDILQKIKKLKIISRNPFMSPLLAPDELLRHMPPLYFISLNFDPCLDDSITFAKRLKSLNCHVVLDVLDGLPHGFLNFLPFSQEAHNGSNLCVKRLLEAMKLHS
ncbi:hormone-sensitive lipase-like [Uloborus diversus]|uniref:hormone-sensitive lipase-like n=1 Tax=Uloborus diversus TaxID=327109 RepID=UPI00240A9261|nr:hormone-sensitive lipase-like [Uloborus diversus]